MSKKVEVGAIQAQSFASAVDLVLKIYKALMPFLTALAAVPLIPPTWRAALIAFLQALDLAATAPSSIGRSRQPLPNALLGEARASGSHP
ncbi:MAG TPA: hypothetical protein VGJ82_02755 [Thermoanaerobaculia bacterium]|jgi:hypothetical protein